MSSQSSVNVSFPRIPRYTVLLIISLLAFIPFSYSQNYWTPSGTNISNTNTGNVGIGTSSPWSALDIRTNGSAANGYYGLNVQNPSTSGWATVNINLGSGSSSGSLISSQRNNLGNGAYLFFQTTDPTGTSQNRMMITDAGNVGIGTTSPWTKLDIRTPGAAANDQNALNIQNPSTTAYSAVQLSLTTGTGGSSSQVYAIRDNLTQGSTLIFYNTDVNGNLQPNMTIEDNGSVGIGTLNTGTNKLAVEGTIAARKVLVTLATPFPDYVFNKGYHLPSLKDIEKYIQAYHHLPELPKADSVAKNGLDLGTNQTILLKKIEELTLYAITQHKQLESQEKEINRLKEENKTMKLQQQKLDTLEEEVQTLLLSMQKDNKTSQKR